MAVIHNQPMNPEQHREYLSKLCDGSLMAQECVQQGGIHVISTLLRIGCNEENAMVILQSLRTHAALIREETERRGIETLFPDDQTNFN